jgi:hypothetical protein
MKPTLTPLNLAIIETVARFRLMTTEQLHRALSAKREKLASVENFSNILRRLHSLGFIARDWVSVLPAERTAFSKPSAIWHLKPEHLKAVLAELERTERADLYEPLRDYEASVKDGAPLAENTLRHELAITDFYLSKSLPDPNRSRLALWLRTSPRHPDISRDVFFTQTDKKTGKKTERRLPLNPDGFHITHTEGKGFAFFFLEMDRSTEAPEKLANKFLAYFAYHQQKTFGADIAAPITRRFHLPLQHPEAAPFRVLFVTPTERRRNDLLLKSRVLPLGNLFHFATLPDVQKNPHGEIWLSKDTFLPHLDEYNERTHTDTPSTLRAWAHAILDALPKHAL